MDKYEKGKSKDARDINISDSPRIGSKESEARNGAKYDASDVRLVQCRRYDESGGSQTPGSPRAQMAATLRLYSVVMISATQLPRKQNAIFPSVCRGAIFVARNASRVSQSPKRIEIVE